MGKITDEYVKETCRPGQGEKTCRYLLMGPEGWECGKMDPSAKIIIDRRVGGMAAKADNCEGGFK
jgi:hypothetical protein